LSIFAVADVVQDNNKYKKLSQNEEPKGREGRPKPVGGSRSANNGMVNVRPDTFWPGNVYTRERVRLSLSLAASYKGAKRAK
jgi:hypothetical protein